jgi:predicted HicB family RNase H-like nuclease
MTDIAKLNIEINSQKAKQAKTDLDQLTRSGQQAEKGMGSLSAAAKRLGVALAAAFSAYAVVNETRKMIQAASDLEETLNKFNVVFRGMQDQADEWTKNLQKNFNMSETAARSYLASVQDMLVPMGMAREEAGQLSNKIVELSADLGSFNNMPTADVMRDIQAALSGEYEGLRKYGVMLNATKIQQAALTAGLAATKDELTEADKALTTYRLILEGSADAIGDVARSQGTYAYELRRLIANIDDFRTAVGTKLLPIATEYVSKLNEWVKTNETFLAQDVPEHVRKIADDLLKIVGALSDVKVIYDSLPSDVVGPGSSGLVGYLLFGKTGAVLGLAANLVPAIANIIRAIDQINKGNMSVGEFAGMNADDLADFLDELEEKSRKVYYAIDENTEGFDKYSEATRKAEVATGDMAGATSNLAGNANKLTEAMKKAMAEQAAWEHEASIKAIQYAEEARQKYWQESIETMNEMVAREKEAWEKLQDEKADAAKKALEEQSRAEEEARREYEREWERVYDDMHEFAADTFYDIFDGQLDSFEDFADAMLDVFKRMLANMAAEAAMTNIFKPMMNQMAGSALGSVFGLPSLSMSGSSGVGALTMLPGMGLLGATIPGTAIIGSELGWGAAAARNIGVMASPGVTWGSALGAGALGSLGYSTLGSAIGLPTSGYSGITSGLGAAGMSAYGGSLAGLTGIGALGGPIGIGLGALAGGLLGGLFGGGSDPKPALGIQGGLSSDHGRRPTDFYDSRFFNWTVFEQDLSADAAIAIRDYFDNYFLQIDTAVNGALKETFNKYDPGAVNRGWVYTEGLDAGQIVNGISDTVYKSILEGLKTESLGAGFEAFDTGFFESIKTEGQDLFQAYVGFYDVVSNTQNFLEDFTRRVDNLGQTSVEAYQQIQLVSGVLAEMGMAVEQITGSAVIGQINTLSDTWNAYIDVMWRARATAEQLAEAEAKRNLVVGAQITGLTATSLQSEITDGGDISSIIEKSLTQVMAGLTAEYIVEKYITPLNEAVGKAWIDTSGDIEAVLAVIQGYDLSPAIDEINTVRDKIEELTRQIWNLEDATEAAAQALSKASAAMDDAANAYLSALQSELSNLQSSFDSAKNTYVDFLQEAISSHQEELQVLEGRMNDAKSNYLSALQSEASEQEALANSIGSAIDSIRDFRKSLSTGTGSPLNLEQRQAELMLQQTILAGQVKAGDTNSVSELISISSEYLDVTKSLASNEFEYAREVSRTSKLMSDVESSLDVQKSVAERQAESLQNIYDSVSGTSRTTEDLAAAERAYYSAKSAFDSSSHRTEMEHLQNIIDEVTMANENAQTLAEAQAEYEAAKMALDENWYTDEIAMLEEMLGSTQSIEELMEAFIRAQAAYDAAKVAASYAQERAAQEATSQPAPGQAPFNFDEEKYIVNKAAQVNAKLRSGDAKVAAIVAGYGLNPSSTLSTADIKNAFAQAGLTARQHYSEYGYYEGVQPFATGGSFTVAGMSGRDNLTLPDLRVSAGEMVNISRPDVMSSVSEELTALRAEVKQLREENKAHAIAQIKSSQAIERNTDYLESWDVNGLPAEEAAA